MILRLENATKNVTAIEFIIQFSAGYWYLTGINVTEKGDAPEYQLKVKEVYAPVGFSYHCTAGVFYGSDTKQNLTLPNFQVRCNLITQIFFWLMYIFLLDTSVQ